MIRVLSSVIVVLLTLGLPESARAQSLIFRDRFDRYAEGRELPKPWSYSPRDGATFRIEGDRLRITSQAVNPVASIGVSDARNCVLSLRVRDMRRGGNWVAVQGPEGWRVTLPLPGKEDCTVSNARDRVHETINLGTFLRNTDDVRVQIASIERGVKVLIDDRIIYARDQQAQSSVWELKLMGSWSSDIFFDEIEVRRIDSSGFDKLGQALEIEERAIEREHNHTHMTALPASSIQTTISAANGPDDFVFAPGDTVTARIHYDAVASDAVSIQYRLVNYYGEVVWHHDDQVGRSDAGKQRQIAFILPQKGIFRFEVVTSDGATAGEMVLGAVSPRLSRLERRVESPFGITPILDQRHLGLVRHLGASWLRLHDMDLATYWPHVEPTKGQFRWRDEQIDLAHGMGFQIMGGFEGTPPWASNAPEELKQGALRPHPDPTIWRAAWGYPPRDLNDVASYVQATVRHYTDRIKVWEVWNEPHVDLFWKGSVAQYVEMSKVIYAAAKAEDSDCIIVGGGGVSLFSYPWIEEAFARGLLDHCDVFAIHGYAEDAVETVDAEDMRTWVERIRKLMRQHGRVRPIWLTETGVHGGSLFSDPTLHSTASGARHDYRGWAAKTVRTYVTCMAAGIDKVFLWRLRRWPISYHQAHQLEGMIEYSGAPKAPFYAYAAMVDVLDQATFFDQVELGEYIRCRVFDRGRGAVAVVWTVLPLESNAVLRVSPGDIPTDAVDIMGNPAAKSFEGNEMLVPIGYEPLYVVSEGLNAKELAQRMSKSRVEGLYLASATVERLKRSHNQRALLEEKKAAFEFARMVSDERWFTVDLRRHATMGFADDVVGDGKGGWTDGGPLNDMRDMPLGLRRYCGVPFDVIDPRTNSGTSVITLYSSHLTTMPREVEGIAVERQAERLYFMHSAAWAENAGKVAEYTVHYVDGTTEQVSIVSGVNIGDWWLPPDADEESQVVAVTTFNYLVYDSRVKYLRIHEWTNPQPEKKIARIDMRSEGRAVPVVLAITGVTP